jgi:putative ABC transport system permease protein
VRKLDLKLLRDLRGLKAQVVTIALVVASGVAALVASLITHDSLKLAQATFYRQGRFADVFSELKRAPLPVREDLRKIDGVAALETRVVQDALLEIPDRVDPAVGRFLSVPEDGRIDLNRVHVREGRMIDPKKGDEVLASEGFAKANGFKPGDEIVAILEGKYKKLRIAGTALSPEYVYAIRGGAPLPNDREFGIFWIAEKTLASALDMQGAFNSVTLTLAPGADRPRAIEAIDRILAPYGGFGAYDREDQLSHRFLSDEIEQQRVSASIVPFVFLAVSAYLLNVVISRLIGLQRGQIATLKAVGYGNWAISLHYLKTIAVIVLLGAAIGYGAGVWIGRKLTVVYTDFFHFPVLVYRLNPWQAALAAGVSFLSAAAGGYGALRRVFRLAPAEAMRPPVPLNFHRALAERLGVARFLSTTGRIVFRNLTIRPLRSGLGVVGIAFALMILMLGLFWRDSVAYIVYQQFSVLQRDDVTVAFTEKTSPDALREIAGLPGVMAVEGYRTLPVRVRRGQASKQTGLFGFPAGARLREIRNQNMRRVPLPPEGAILSRNLAERLGISPGETFEADVLEGRRPTLKILCAGVVDSWVGSFAAMDLAAVNRLTGEDVVSSASILVDEAYRDELLLRLRGLPRVGAVNVKATAVRMFEKTMASFILVYAAVLTGFAAIIAVGVVYNGARVSLSERTWELLSLRVLGFTRNEVFRILAGEAAVLTIFAVPLGWFLGYWFARLMVALIHTEEMQIPMHMEPVTLFYAAAVVVTASVLSMLIIRRIVNRMDLVAALKVPE